jgi:hypothetical protein
VSEIANPQISTPEPASVKPSVTTQEQYDALPRGVEYTENGKTYRKP